MDKQEHATRLARALGASRLTRQDVADAVGRGTRTVSNWTSKTDPTMPTEAEKIVLRRLLGPYDAEGDAVEVAIDQSPLAAHRRTLVKGYYQTQLYEQQVENERRRGA